MRIILKLDFFTTFREGLSCKTVFLSLEPEERFVKLSSIVVRFKLRSIELKAPFTVLLYGSGSYGFNKKQEGKLDDLDLFLIFPRNSDISELLKVAEEVFETKFDVRPEYLSAMCRHEWEMCRMYGRTDNIKLGFRLMCQDVFESLSSVKGAEKDIRNVAAVGSSRIVKDVEWSIPAWKYVPIELPSVILEKSKEALLSVHHHVFSRRKKHLGALGRKLLTCKVIYDHSQNAKSTLESIWRIFVRKCRLAHPDISKSEIVAAIMRAEKFSPEFRRRLLNIISSVSE